MTLSPETLGPTICIGEILAEFIATTVGEGFAEPVPLIGPYPSGAPAIFIDQCSRMGGAAAIIGTVGNDDFGRMTIDRLRRDGVDVSGVSVEPDLPTGTAFVRYRADGNRDFVFNMWTSAVGQLTWTDAVDAVVASAGHLHVMGTLLGNPVIWPIIERAADIIKARGGTVSLDPNMRKELQSDVEIGARVAAMIKNSDLLLPSGDELFAAAGLSSDLAESKAVQKLFDLGPSEIVLKRGAQGSSCYQTDGIITHAPAYVVESVDPTGAGDCFGGAYVAARRLRLPLEQALSYGNAAGARNVTMCGPMEGAGSRAELDAFIAETEIAK